MRVEPRLRRLEERTVWPRRHGLGRRRRYRPLEADVVAGLAGAAARTAERQRAEVLDAAGGAFPGRLLSGFRPLVDGGIDLRVRTGRRPRLERRRIEAVGGL